MAKAVVRNILLFGTIFILQSCVFTSNDLSIKGKKGNINAIKGTVSFFEGINIGFSSAHAGVSSVCASNKSSGSQLYAELRGIKSDGTKELICDVDLDGATYEFDIQVSNIDELYPVIQIDVIDTRPTPSFANRKIITSSTEKNLDINPDVSLTAAAIEKIVGTSLFVGTPETVRTNLEQKRQAFSPEKLATVLPDLFSGASDSAKKLEHMIGFFQIPNVETNFSNIANQLNSATPAPVTLPNGVDLCSVNLKSSESCIRKAEDQTCYNDDFAPNFSTYSSQVLNDSGDNFDLSKVIPATASCTSEQITKLARWHVSQESYYSSSCEQFLVSTIMSDKANACGNAAYNNIPYPECKWEANFFCYVHGDFVSEGSNGGSLDPCGGFDMSICANPMASSTEPRCTICQSP